MQIHDINTIISELTSLYDSLNKRWQNDTCASDLYQSYRQSEYHEIYEKLNEYNIESIILGIIANSLDKKVLTRLRVLLYDNIQTYQTRQADFSSIDFSKIYSLHEEHLFTNKFALLAKDKEDISNFSHPTEQEKEMLLKENQQEKNLLENERSEYIRSNIWMLKDFYSFIYEITKSSISIIESYFPAETAFDRTKCNQKEKDAVEPKPEAPQDIDPDTIFRTGMFNKFLILEKRLIEDKYMDENLNWVAKLDTTKRTDIRTLIIFLVGLLDNKYFLPGKDPKVRTFFENRYNIKIGQNFEKSRRTELDNQYRITFLYYPF